MTTTSPSFTKEIRYNKGDFDMYLDGQYIGSRSTHHQAEIDLDQHVFDLISDGMCFTATELDGGSSVGEITADQSLVTAFSANGWESQRTHSSIAARNEYLYLNPQAHIVETPRHTIFCVCSAAGVIVTPNGTLCGACFEACDLWRLWKTDSTAFVAELRRQSCRLNEMAVRLVVWLNAKNGSALGTDSILAMWRQLLNDGEPPEPRYYVVAPAQQRVAA